MGDWPRFILTGERQGINSRPPFIRSPRPRQDVHLLALRARNLLLLWDIDLRISKTRFAGALWKCKWIHYRSVALEIVRAENDFKGAAPADQKGETFRAAAARMQSGPDFGLSQSRVLPRREAHVAGQDEFTARAPDTSPDLCDADHRGLGKTDKRIKQDWESGRPDRCHHVPEFARQIKVGEEELRVRALEYNDA